MRTPGPFASKALIEQLERHGELVIRELETSLRARSSGGVLGSTARRKLRWARLALLIIQGKTKPGARSPAAPKEEKVSPIEANRRREIREKPRKRGKLIPVETCAAIGAVVRAEAAKETRAANRRLVAARMAR